MSTEGMTWLEPQQSVVTAPASLLDVFALIPLMMVIFTMSFAFKAIQPEVVREVAPEVRKGVVETIGIYRGVPPIEYEEQKRLPSGGE